MKDKDGKAMVSELKKLNFPIIATQPTIERALPAKDLYELCVSLKVESVRVDNIIKAYYKAKEIVGKNGRIIITGSNFLVGEALEKLKL